MKKTWAFFLPVLMILFFLFIFIFNHKETRSNPILTLKGSNIISIHLGDKYIEPGYRAYDPKDGDITDKVVIFKNMDFSKVGTYEIIYKVKNSSGVLAVKHRFVKVVSSPYYKDDYDKIDNTKRGWWANNNMDKARPSGGADINELKKYNAYYIGPDDKVIYLTFDEGTLDTYVKEIVDVLDKNDVKATFFLCYKFMVSNKDLIKNMVKNGHLIGNHTVNHYSMPSLANKESFSQYLYEVEKVEDGYYEITHKKMEKIYRDPRGEWSFRDLQIMKDLGYKSYFYSAYYMDFGEDVSKEYALNELEKRYHNGAIYLIHPKNKGNYLALNSFIKKMKSLGFRFDLVKNIP